MAQSPINGGRLAKGWSAARRMPHFQER
jgi:hypothetical protein